MEMRIRKARLNDTDLILALTKELGYHSTAEEIKARIKRISRDSKQDIIVAENDKVIGWMHIALTEPLESNSFVEIRGIVVKEEFREKGVGTKLIKRAEMWARGKGCSYIRIRTNISRTATRKYYRKLGFILKKTQEVYVKEIY